MKAVQRRGSATTAAVFVLAAVLIGAGVWYFVSDPFHTKVNANFNWRHGPWRVGLSANYVSEVYQTSLLSSTGEPWTVGSQLTGNAYAQYDFSEMDTKIRVGVRDFTDEGPSLADGGYLGSVQRPWGRYWYINISKTL